MHHAPCRTPLSAEQFDSLMPKALQVFAESAQLQAWEPLPESIREAHELMPWAKVRLWLSCLQHVCSRLDWKVITAAASSSHGEPHAGSRCAMQTLAAVERGAAHTASPVART